MNRKKFFLCIVLINPIILIHCFSELRAPPITLTKTLTAAEKQMLGEDKELEKNGWAIASIKASYTGAEDWKASSEKEALQDDKEFSEIQKVLVYTAFEIYKLKKQGVLGESLSGNLEFINYASLDSSEKVRLDSIVKLTNQARAKLREIQLNSLKKKLNQEEYKKQEESLRLEYWRTVEYGMYFEEPKGVWKKKI